MLLLDVHPEGIEDPLYIHNYKDAAIMYHMKIAIMSHLTHLVESGGLESAIKALL